MNSKTLALLFALTASVAPAQVLMLDFGPTAVVSPDFTNSPYHAATGSTTGTWNTSITGDVTSGLLYANNTPASGVSVNMGVSSGATTTINLASNTFSTLLGSATNTGIYENSSVGRDAIFTSNNSNPYIGAQIGGLSAGTYDIYISSRNTNTGNNQAAYAQTVYAGKSATAVDFDFSAYSPTSAPLSFASAPAANLSTEWLQGQNYVKLSVTLTAGEYLNIAVAGDGTGAAARGFLNSVQIVNTSTIPEPSAYATLAGLGMLGLAVLRRRHFVRRG